MQMPSLKHTLVPFLLVVPFLSTPLRAEVTFGRFGTIFGQSNTKYGQYEFKKESFYLERIETLLTGSLPNGQKSPDGFSLPYGIKSLAAYGFNPPVIDLRRQEHFPNDNAKVLFVISQAIHGLEARKQFYQHLDSALTCLQACKGSFQQVYEDLQKFVKVFENLMASELFKNMSKEWFILRAILYKVVSDLASMVVVMHLASYSQPLPDQLARALSTVRINKRLDPSLPQKWGEAALALKSAKVKGTESWKFEGKEKGLYVQLSHIGEAIDDTRLKLKEATDEREKLEKQLKAFTLRQK